MEEDLLTVDVRVSPSLLDPNDTLTDEDLAASAGKEGMSAVVDGHAVIHTVTKPQREQMLTEMRTSNHSSVDDLIADESNSITASSSTIRSLPSKGPSMARGTRSSRAFFSGLLYSGALGQ